MADVKHKAQLLDSSLKPALSDPNGFWKRLRKTAGGSEAASSSPTAAMAASASTAALPESVAPPAKEPLKVFLRIRPIDPELEQCLSIQDAQTVVARVPATSSYSRQAQTKQESKYSFSQVFDDRTSQRQIFDATTSRLVKDLLQGYDSLLFTYGITNAGKTYTMQGTPSEPGILARVLDVVFNSIRAQQASPMVFKPNGANGYSLQTEEAAAEERKQKRLLQSKSGKRTVQFGQDIVHESDDAWSALGSKLSEGISFEIDSDCGYTVMASYAEVYNEHCYDLLEETPGMSNGSAAAANFKRTSRPVTQDANHQRYIKGIREVEVRSTQEAFELLRTGQRNRQVASTQLNYESSRSHSIFTIRLVCAPLDETGSRVLNNPKFIRTSSLSLVDLAGSERSKRTQNTGQRLLEAGCINTSLMALTKCMKQLRQLQSGPAGAGVSAASLLADLDASFSSSSSASSTPQKVIFRESKLTHLFQNFFEGHGKVVMIVCVNPASLEHDETSQVLKFSAIAQDVTTAVQTPMKMDTGLTPGRGAATRLINLAKAKLQHRTLDDDSNNADDDDDDDDHKDADQKRTGSKQSSSAATLKAKRTHDESESEDGSPVQPHLDARKHRRLSQSSENLHGRSHAADVSPLFQPSSSASASSSSFSSAAAHLPSRNAYIHGRPSMVIGELTRELLQEDDELSKKAARIRSEIDELERSQESRLKKQSQLLEVNEQRFRKLLEEKTEALSIAERRIGDLQATNGNLLHKVEAAEAQTMDLKKESAIFSSMVKTLEETCATLKEQSRRLQSELVQKENAVDSLVTKVEAQERELRRASAAHEQVASENSILRSHVNDLEASLTALHEQKQREMMELRTAVMERIQQERESWKREIETNLVNELTSMESQIFLERDVRNQLISKLDEVKQILEAPSHLEPVLSHFKSMKQSSATKLSQLSHGSLDSLITAYVPAGEATASMSAFAGLPSASGHAGGDGKDKKKPPKVLNHVPEGTVQPDTIMTPIIPNKKTTASPSLKHMLSKFSKKVKTPHYVVHHQETDDQNRLTSSLYKGRVSKSISSKGISVELTGIESLTAGHPLNPPVSLGQSGSDGEHSGLQSHHGQHMLGNGGDDDDDDDDNDGGSLYESDTQSMASDAENYASNSELAETKSLSAVSLLEGRRRSITSPTGHTSQQRRSSAGSRSLGMLSPPPKVDAKTLKERCAVAVQGNGKMPPSVVHNLFGSKKSKDLPSKFSPSILRSGRK